MDKLLIICGPTATGKTDLAIRLAKKFGGEVISADSRQVYKGMNIGTGKDISNFKFQIDFKFQISNFKFKVGYYQVDGIKIWLYDIVKPDYQFNVADYKECADLVTFDILNRGKLPILVGGTGLYIKAVVSGIETLGVPSDWKLRERLLHCSIASLLEQLKKLDPDRWEEMNESDRNNPRRLVRAIEIAYWKCETGNGKSFDSELRTVELLDKEVGSEKKNSYISLHNPASHFSRLTSPLFIGLTAPYEILYQKIDQRVDERVRQGIEREIRDLIEKGYSFENSALGSTIGYREWRPYFEGKTTFKEVINKWKFAEHAYSRRQMTWFKKALRQDFDGELSRTAQGENKRINWFDISENDWEIKVEKSVEKWLSNMMG